MAWLNISLIVIAIGLTVLNVFAGRKKRKGDMRKRTSGSREGENK